MPGLVYLILVHKNAPQCERLLSAIHDPDNIYFLHVDGKSGADLHAMANRATDRWQNVRVIPSRNCCWGGFSLVAVTLQAIREGVRAGGSWSHFINLSGQDFPLVTQSVLREELERSPDRSFIEVDAGLETEAVIRRRTRRYFIEWGDAVRRVRGLPRWRRFGCPIHKGSQWFILSRAFCDYMVREAPLKSCVRYFRFTEAPDELFFQTLMMNSRFRETVVGDNRRMIQWRPDGGPRIFRKEDYDALMESGDFFARKFDSNADDHIIRLLESHLRGQQS